MDEEDKCGDDEIRALDSNEESFVCIKKEDIRKAGERYGDGYSSFDYRGIEDSEDYLKRIFITDDDEPNFDYYEKIDDLWSEPPPDGYAVEAMVEELANDTDASKEDLENNEEVLELLREGFWNKYDSVGDVANALGGDAWKVFLPLKHIKCDEASGLVADVDAKKLVEAIREAGAECNGKHNDCMQKFGEKIVEKGVVSRVVYDGDRDCYGYLSINNYGDTKPMYAYLKTVVDGTNSTIRTNHYFEECDSD